MSLVHAALQYAKDIKYVAWSTEEKIDIIVNRLFADIDASSSTDKTSQKEFVKTTIPHAIIASGIFAANWYCCKRKPVSEAPVAASATIPKHDIEIAKAGVPKDNDKPALKIANY